MKQPDYTPYPQHWIKALVIAQYVCFALFIVGFIFVDNRALTYASLGALTLATMPQIIIGLRQKCWFYAARRIGFYIVVWTAVVLLIKAGALG